MGHKVIRLGHVNIRTPRLEETAAFYSSVLGLRAGGAATRPGSDDHIWLHDDSGAAPVHLQRSAYAVLPGESGVHHIAFDCDDPDQWRERLSALGIAYTETRFDEAGMEQLNIADPNGIRLELTFRR